MPFRTDDARVGWTSLRSTPVAGCNVYLKQVELENFKSFGGKLTVPLMEGYTAVTGPNGSGKSNITDAILFVLGPKSSKAVRAGKLQRGDLALLASFGSGLVWGAQLLRY